jgi:DNA-binding beta-propeller fold protein YncE
MTMTAGLLTSSCFLDADPSEPGYPSVLMATIDLDSLGLLQKCATTTNGALLVSVGSSVAVIRLDDGSLLDILELGSSVCDLGDTDAAGYAYILTDDRLTPVSLGSWELQTPVTLGTGCLYTTVSPETGRAWVVDQADIISEVDLATGAVLSVPGKLVSDCMGLACSEDGSALFAVDGAENALVKLSTSGWTVSGTLDLSGGAIDLFRGPSGFVCCIVEGSNEIWFIDVESCTLTLMTTIPEVPLAAAVMPDRSFSYASCPGSGLVVVSSSGQIEYHSTEMGLPASIAISGDGSRVALCCPDEGVVRLLD